MASKIDERFGSSTQLVSGGGGIFDVHVNGELVYSKHETGEFPDEDRLVEEIAQSYA